MTFFMAAMGAIMLMAGLVLISFLVGQATTPYLAAAEARYMVGRVTVICMSAESTLWLSAETEPIQCASVMQIQP
jgi:hypothetical protein